MAFDARAAERIRDLFATRRDVAEKQTFGGLAFMVRGHMCCGVVGDTLMARVGPEHYDAALRRRYARVMDFTGRPMKGFVYVDPPGFEADDALSTWVEMCLDFVTSLAPK
jgi:hypothetical protein